MAQEQTYKAAQIIEERRLVDRATGIPTLGDVSAAEDIDDMHEAEFRRRLAVALDDARREADARVKEAKIEALESAVQAYSRECIGFQEGWGSNEMDQAKLSMLDKTLAWLKVRRDKYNEPLPRYINLRDTYKSLSDGAKIEVDSVIYYFQLGFGTFRSDDGSVIQGRSFNKQVTLLDNNL